MMKSYRELLEGKTWDSDKLQKLISSDLDSIKDEKDLYVVMKKLVSEIKKSFPSGKITEKDLKHILNQPTMKEIMKKEKVAFDQILFWIDFWE